MVEGLDIKIAKPGARESPDNLKRLVLSVKNSSLNTYSLKITARFYVSNDKLKWEDVPFSSGQSSFATSHPNTNVNITTSINIPVSTFEEYKYLKTDVIISVYYLGDSGPGAYAGKIELSKVTENTSYTVQTAPPGEIPRYEIHNAVRDQIKRRSDYIFVDDDLHLLDETTTVQMAGVTAISGAWLFIDTDVDKMEISVKTSGVDARPAAVVSRWLNGYTLRVVNVYGVDYVVKLPVSLLIFFSNGTKKFYGSVLSEKDAMGVLAIKGKIGDVVEEVLEQKPGDVDEALRQLQEVEQAKETLSDIKNQQYQTDEKEDSKILYIGLGLFVIIIIGLLIFRRR